jgi:hypothetical protein
MTSHTLLRLERHTFRVHLSLSTLPLVRASTTLFNDTGSRLSCESAWLYAA